MSAYTYTPIPLGPSTTIKAQIVVRHHVEPLLRDAKRMLHLPIEGNDLPAFNLSVAIVLCSTVGGISDLFLDSEYKEGRAFKLALARYNADYETGPAQFVEDIYDRFRSPLVHSLGFFLKNRQRSPERQVSRHEPRLVGAQWDDLDDIDNRPDWLQPTLFKSKSGAYIRCVESFYWGVRKLIRDLADAPEQGAEVWRIGIVNENQSVTTSTPTTSPDVSVTTATASAESFTVLEPERDA